MRFPIVIANRCNPGAQAGFSLVELLIVCLIIALLAAVAVPAYHDYLGHRSITASLQALDDFFENDIHRYIAYRKDPAPRLELVSSQAHYAAASAVDKIYDQLPSAYTYIGAPNRMNLEETRRLHLALSLKELADVQTLFGGEAVIDTRNVKISDRVQVQLESHEFDVKAETPIIQAVRRRAVTQWSWAIRPKRAGKHTLNLTVSAIVSVSGAETPLVLTTYARTIEVDVTRTQVLWRFLQENMAWLWAPAAALGGGVWWLAGILRKKKGKPSKPATPSKPTERPAASS